MLKRINRPEEYPKQFDIREFFEGTELASPDFASDLIGFQCNDSTKARLTQKIDDILNKPEIKERIDEYIKNLNYSYLLGT